jgi:hypothetical protein
MSRHAAMRRLTNSFIILPEALRLIAVRAVRRAATIIAVATATV